MSINSNLTKQNRIGLAALVGIVAIYLVVISYIRSSSPEALVQVNYIRKIDASNEHPQEELTIENPTNHSQKKKISPFYPDSLNLSGWMNLDFSQKQAQAILNFKKSINGFHHSSDLKKIFVISDEKFAELEPFMRFSVPTDEAKNITKKSFNSATIDDLMEIKTIGEKLANIILDFRNKKGGFYSFSQLREIYILKEDDSLCSKIETFFYIDLNEIKKIQINSASKKELQQLPGLNFESIALIMKEREIHRLENLDFISEAILSEENKNNLLPYLSFR